MNYKHYIEGERIYLREVRIDDVNENYYNWMNDSDVNQYLETRYIPQSIENIKKFVTGMDAKRDEIFLAICLKENDQHIGNIKLGPINWIHKFGDISLLIGDKNCWGKGYATEAIKLISNFAFSVLNMHKLIAGCYIQNKGSAGAFEKAGYKREATLKNHWYANGKYYDEYIYALFNELN
jgi:[ribosomal protein S5]-alanine N-acetyltransferase